MNRLKEISTLILWAIVGAMFIEMELLVLKIIDTYMIFSNLLMIIIPVIVFIVLNFHNKMLVKNQILISHYFIKSIICIYGGMIIKGMYYYYTDDSLGAMIAMLISTVLIVFVICMIIMQKLSQRINNSEMYLGYIVLGVALSLNIGFIVGNYDLLDACLDKMLRYGIILLLSIIINIYRYIRYHRVQKEVRKISGKEYSFNAFKMVMISLLLFTLPFSVLLYTMIRICNY